MSEEKKIAQNDNNVKLLLTMVIVLVALLAVAVFALQQKKNDGTTAGSTSGGTAESTQDTPQASDAGALGKNEVKLTDANFKAEVEDYKGVVLVDFYLSTCPHCQNVAKDVTAVSDTLAGKAKVGKMEVKENKTTSDKFSIEGVPTFIVFKDGQQVEKVSGEQTQKELLDLVNKHL